MFGIATDFPLYFSIFCIIIGVSFAFLLYNSEKKIISKLLKGVLFSIRTVLISILCYFLLNPIVKTETRIYEKPIIIIAQDCSESVQESIVDDLIFLEDNLSDFQIQKLSFSYDVSEGYQKENIGSATDYSNLFKTIDNKFENRNVAGVVLASDGNYNSGSNPEYFNISFPIYSIALGDTNIYKDIAIDNIVKNDISFLGNRFPVEIEVNSKLAKGEKSKLTIWNNGIKVHNEILSFTTNEDFKKVQLSLESDKVGLQTYKVILDPLPQEKDTKNNTFKFYIDVIESRYNILMLSGKLHPDIAAIKSVIDKNKNNNIEFKSIDDQIKYEKYQLIVLFGIDQLPDALQKNDIPLLVFNSTSTNFQNLGSSFKFNSKETLEDVSAARSSLFTKFVFSPQLERLIKNAPPLSVTFGSYEIDGDICPVLLQKIGDLLTDRPLLMIEEINNKKVAFITAEGWWRWKFFDYSENQNNKAFDEFFSKLIKYLLLHEDKSLFRVDYQNQINESENVIFDASLYNESYELIDNKHIILEINNSNGNQFNYQFSKQNKKYIADIGVLEAGNYTFIAKVIGTDLVKKGVFDVIDLQLEGLNSTANHQLLYKLADLSNGAVFYQDQFEELSSIIIRSERNKKIIHNKERLDSLINIPWLLVSLLLLISVEWFLRKYNGLI